MSDEANDKSDDSDALEVDTASISDKEAIDLIDEANPTVGTAGSDPEPEPGCTNINQNVQTSIRRSQRIKEKQGNMLDPDIIGETILIINSSRG